MADGYQGKDVSIDNRFHPLSIESQKLFKTSNNTHLCLYNQQELEHLLKECGFHVDYSYLSKFGNIRAIAHK